MATLSAENHWLLRRPSRTSRNRPSFLPTNKASTPHVVFGPQLALQEAQSNAAVKTRLEPSGYIPGLPPQKSRRPGCWKRLPRHLCGGMFGVPCLPLKEHGGGGPLLGLLDLAPWSSGSPTSLVSASRGWHPFIPTVDPVQCLRSLIFPASVVLSQHARQCRESGCLYGNGWCHLCCANTSCRDSSVLFRTTSEQSTALMPIRWITPLRSKSSVKQGLVGRDIVFKLLVWRCILTAPLSVRPKVLSSLLDYLVHGVQVRALATTNYLYHSHPELRHKPRHPTQQLSFSRL